MEIFKIKLEDKGKVFIVRPLPNAKNLKENILSYKTGFSNNRWSYRHMCFALVNDELNIFNFSKEVHKLIMIDGIPKLLMMDSNKAIKITVGVREGFLDNQYEIIEDDKFRFDTDDEKRNYIKKLLTTTDLDLSQALKEEKLKIGHLEIKLPRSNGEFSVKTLKEIYDSE